MNNNIDYVTDTSVFKAPTQTSIDDRIALESIRAWLVSKDLKYNYLELGSYLGGTLLPHIVSKDCGSVMSVDRRVSSQPDERRAVGYSYEGVTTDDLKAELGRHVKDTDSLNKMETYDGVIGDLNPSEIRKKWPVGFHLCFIDAEHTNEAVFSDFLHTLQLAAPNSVIMLHDSWMMSAGIQNIISHLQNAKKQFYFSRIKDSVTAFFLGEYANEKQLPKFVRNAFFDVDGYFQESNRRLWEYRKTEIIGEVESDVRNEIIQALDTRKLLKLLFVRDKTNFFDRLS